MIKERPEEELKTNHVISEIPLGVRNNKPTIQVILQVIQMVKEN